MTIKKKLLLIFFGVILSLLLGELYFRIFNPQLTYSSFLLPYDFHCFINVKSFYPIALKPNQNCLLHGNLGQFKDTYIKTNSMGLRNREIVTPKPKGVTRILFIGDSYTAGWGVDANEAFPQLTEKTLREKYPNKKIEVINAGLPSAGPNYFYLFLKNEINKLQPDIIVVGFWMVKHIPDSVYYTDWIKTDSEGLPTQINRRQEYIDFSGNISPITLPFNLEIPILRESQLVSFISSRLAPYNFTMSQPDEALNPRACLYKEFCHYLDEAKARTKKLFSGMKELADKRNAKFLVVFIPAEFQIDPNATIKNNINVPLLPADLDRPYKEFEGFFAENGIDYLDMRSFFRNGKIADGEFYFKTDNHFNSTGHKVAADAISQKLTDYIK